MILMRHRLNRLNIRGIAAFRIQLALKRSFRGLAMVRSVLYALLFVAATASAQLNGPPRWLKPYVAQEGDEELIFTPRGFTGVGKPAIAKGKDLARLDVTIRDSGLGEPTFCRVNVVGSDGQFYQPLKSRLTDYSLTGMWPKQLAGNRPGKAPVRYLGRFFYSNGKFTIFVPPGATRVEVWKGFEFTPTSRDLTLARAEQRSIELKLQRKLDMRRHDYHSGDMHLHFDRVTTQDDQTILDLLEAEDVRYGGVLCYNGTSSYVGTMAKQDIPQLRGLGLPSLRSRGEYQIFSGQEYRSAHYGHIKVFLSESMVQTGKSYDPNQWPLFGEALRPLRDKGAVAFWAHGGYSKEIFADVPLGTVDGVELLQFGIYRPVGLEGWYKALNMGFRFPALGASDYPACRKLCDCVTYVHSEGKPGMDDWIRAAADGRSFMTTGPLILLEVNGEKPGGTIRSDRAVNASVSVRVLSEVAPVTNIDLIANGKVIAELLVDKAAGQGSWIELQKELLLDESTWLAAAAYSQAKTGSPDAESHTNPVYVYLKNRAPFVPDDLDWWLEQLEGRITFHNKRKLGPDREKILAYFVRARERLIQIRAAGGIAME
jgi:hypothetical protein